MTWVLSRHWGPTTHCHKGTHRLTDALLIFIMPTGLMSFMSLLMQTFGGVKWKAPLPTIHLQKPTHNMLMKCLICWNKLG